MWVRLTVAGLNAVREAARVDPVLAEELETEIVPAGDVKFDVHGPCIMWTRLQTQLMRTIFGPRGGKQKGKFRDFTALKAITRALNRQLSHPALSGVGMLGWETDLIPAWRLPDGTYSPTPAEGEFVVLGPIWEKASNSKVTRWVPMADTSRIGRLADEGVHLRLR